MSGRNSTCRRPEHLGEPLVAVSVPSSRRRAISRCLCILSMSWLGACGRSPSAIAPPPPPRAAPALSPGAPVVPATTRAAAAPRPVGAACAFAAQCASGVCSGDEQKGTCGACLERRRLGERCDRPGQACSPTAECRDGVCRTKRKGPGEPCQIRRDGPIEERAGGCDDDLFCTLSGAHMCTAPVHVGAACSPTDRCERGAVCDRGTCVPAAPADAGGSCEAQACKPGLFCDESHGCRAASLARGAACGKTDDKCVSGTICGNLDFPNGGGRFDLPLTCVALPKAGEPCVRESCAEGFFCHLRPDDDSVAHLPKCEAGRKAGESCSLDRRADVLECAPGLECRAGTCAPPC